MKTISQLFVVVWVCALTITSAAQVKIAGANALRGHKPVVTQLTGVVGLEVRDETETSPLEHRYFLQKWEGETLLHIFLESDDKEVNFEELLHREVTFFGYAKNRTTFMNNDGKSESFDETFVVTKVGSVREEPTVNNVMAGPLTLPAPTHGQRKVLVQPITFAANPSHPFTKAEAEGFTFTDQKSVRNWVRDASFRSYDINGINNPNGDVANWIPLSASTDNCVSNMSNAWRIEADNMAEAQGFSKTQYQTRIHIYPNIPGCTRGYSATIGQFGSHNGVQYIFMHLPSDFQTNPVARQGFFVSLIHELVHNLGQSAHDNSQHFEGGPIVNQSDRGSILGAVNMPIFPSNILRMKLGWMATSKCRIVEGQGSHFVPIQTPAIPTKGIGPSSPPVCTITQLRDLNGNLTGEVLIPERRRQTGFWEQFPTNTQDYVSGIALRRVNANLASSANGSVLVNPRPDLGCCFNAVVMPGMSWTILANNYTLQAGHPTVYSQPVTIALGSNYPVSVMAQQQEFVIPGYDFKRVE